MKNKLSMFGLPEKETDFISDSEYNDVCDYVAKKHPGYVIHALGRNINGGINYQAFHIEDKNFATPIEGVMI